MESISKLQNEDIPKKNSIISLKSKLNLSNQKLKYKKQYLRFDSIQKNNDTCEMTGISRINSINPTTSTPLSTSRNKKPKGRVSFAPKFRLISYIYYDPREVIHKEENKDENINKIINEEIEIIKDKEDYDKVITLCSCILI